MGRLTIEAQLNGTGPVTSREGGFGGGQPIVDLRRDALTLADEAEQPGSTCPPTS